MKKLFLFMLTTLLTSTMVGCSNNPATDMMGEQAAETIANVFPAHGSYNFLTGKLFSQDQDKEAIVLEISVPGSNYNAVTRQTRTTFAPLALTSLMLLMVFSNNAFWLTMKALLNDNAE